MSEKIGGPSGSPAVIALGANLGDRRATLAAAVRAIADLPGVELTAVSSFIETAALKPQGVDTEAPAYLNGVATVLSDLGPHALLDALNAIEHAHGRVRAEHWGDRTLDLDLITFAEVQQSDDRLTLPHPRAAERDFVLRPWLELQPDAALPGLGRIDALLAALPTAPPVSVEPETPLVEPVETAPAGDFDPSTGSGRAKLNQRETGEER